MTSASYPTLSALRDAVGTIIVVIMENRSFDHMLGHLRFNGSRPDVDGVVGPDLTAPAYLNPGNGQGYSPFLVAQSGRLPGDLPHGLHDVRTQLAYLDASRGYGMNGFAQAYLDAGGAVSPDLPPMGFNSRESAPVSAWLADNFTICNRWFCSLPSSTHPNKLMALAGKSVVDDTAAVIPPQDTLLDWLDARKIDWRVYHDGAFSFFALLPQYWSWFVGPRFRRFNRLQGDLRDGSAPAPQVIIVEPAYADAPMEQHPNDNHPPLSIAFGESFLLRVYEALCSAPVEVSSRTVLIGVHDEHGGFWDHVPPHPTPGYVSVSGTPFDSTGPRIPAFIVSPLVSGKRAISDLVFDHTSMLQFIAECFAPGGGTYSHEVDLRASYGFSSVSQALDVVPPRPLPVVPDFSLSAPVAMRTLRPVLTESQRAVAHAIDGILSSRYRDDALAKLPELHAWDAA
ncbi:MAG: phospholipase [Gammaproteobacteria bacterium]|nr:phospholipase [Gammaproteobacteria bacterium]